MLNLRLLHFRHLKTAAFAVILVFLAGPILLLLSVPLIIYKHLVVLLAKVFRPDLASILSPSSAVFAQNDSLEDPKCSVVLPILFDGEFGIQEFRDAFRTRILEHKTPSSSSGELLTYAKLQQCLTDWMGFKFWKEIKDFKLEDYIKVHPDLLVRDEVDNEDEDLITNLSADLVTKPYDKTKSPWEFLLVPKLQTREHGRQRTGTTTALIFRFHHALCDGYSILQLSMLLFGIKIAPTTTAGVIPKQQKSHRGSSLSGSGITFALKFLQKLSQVLLLSFDNSSLWKLADHKKTGKLHIQASKVFAPCGYIKAVKNHHQVSFSSVIYASLTGAIRKISLKKGMQLPEKMPLMLPLLKEGHPGGLVNHL
jgi:hypothetical protein